MLVKISFDLDETLVLNANEGPQERALQGPARLLYHERLRLGTVALCGRLSAAGWQVCIYTASIRPQWYIRGLFARYGIALDLVVNHCEHEKVVQRGRRQKMPKKLPIKFGIDLHVDDDFRVKEYGEIYGFPVVLLDLNDADWADKVWLKAQRIAKQKHQSPVS